DAEDDRGDHDAEGPEAGLAAGEEVGGGGGIEDHIGDGRGVSGYEWIGGAGHQPLLDEKARRADEQEDDREEQAGDRQAALPDVHRHFLDSRTRVARKSEPKV